MPDVLSVITVSDNGMPARGVSDSTYTKRLNALESANRRDIPRFPLRFTIGTVTVSAARRRRRHTAHGPRPPLLASQTCRRFLAEEALGAPAEKGRRHAYCGVAGKCRCHCVECDTVPGRRWLCCDHPGAVRCGNGRSAAREFHGGFCQSID